MKQIASTTSILMLERILQLLLSIAGLAIIGHYLNVEDLGQFATAQNYSSIFLAFAYLAGAELLVPKLITANRYKQAYIIKHGMVLRCIFSGTCLILAIIFAYFYTDLNQNFASIFLLCILGPLIVEPIFTLACWLVAQQYAIYLSIARIFGVCTRFGCIYYLSTQKNIASTYFAAAYFFEYICIAGFIFYFYQKNSNKINLTDLIKVKINTNILQGLAKRGVILGLGLSFNYLFIRLDRLYLAHTNSAYDLGIYQMAMQLNDAWLNSGVIFASMLAPIYFKNSNQNFNIILNKNLNKFILLMLAFASLGSIFIYFFAGYFLEMMLGVKYLKAIDILKIAIWQAIPCFVLQVLQQYLIYQKKYLQAGFNYLIGIVFLSICLFIFEAIFGQFILIHLPWLMFFAYTLLLIINYKNINYKNINYKNIKK